MRCHSKGVKSARKDAKSGIGKDIRFHFSEKKANFAPCLPSFDFMGQRGDRLRAAPPSVQSRRTAYHLVRMVAVVPDGMRSRSQSGLDFPIRHLGLGSPHPYRGFLRGQHGTVMGFWEYLQKHPKNKNTGLSNSLSEASSSPISPKPSIRQQTGESMVIVGFFAFGVSAPA